MTKPKEHTDVEAWMEGLGSKFVIVWFYDHRNMQFYDERHVDDHDTLLETITQTFDRMRWNVAMWDDGTGWTSLHRRTGETRTWPSRAAAEMGAIHNA